MTIVGIELGRNTSRVAVMLGGKVRVIADAEGDTAIPSLVRIANNGEVFVGQPAARGIRTDRENTFFAVEELIGRKYTDDGVQTLLGAVPYRIVAHENGDAWFQTREGNRLSPSQFAGLVLRKMRETAEAHLGKTVTEAVITVPANFNAIQRNAIRVAGGIAGLEVRCIIDETSAAALAYGLEKPRRRRESKIAVYDIGSRTFGISIIAIGEPDGDKQFAVLAAKCGSYLGGKDFDECLIDHIVVEFQKHHGVDLRQDEVALMRIRYEAELAKIDLSSQPQADLIMPYIAAVNGDMVHFRMRVTRRKLESLVGELINRTLAVCGTALADAKLKTTDITEVILVGGQTRMPKVREAVQAFFGTEPRRDVNPDEAVVIGAALRAAGLSCGDRVTSVEVTPVTLGFSSGDGRMIPLIPRGSPIPTQAVHVFGPALPGDAAWVVHLLAGEDRRAAQNRIVASISLPRADRDGQRILELELRFDIDINGFLHVKATDRTTGEEYVIQTRGEGHR